MTRKQRNALRANLAVTIKSRTEVEVYIADGDTGRADFDATEAAMEEVSALLGWGGYRTGYGSWVLRSDYAPCSEDFNSTASRYHY